MKQTTSFFKILFCCFMLSSYASYVTAETPQEVTMQEEKTPEFLYKILSLENWNESQNEGLLKLSSDDDVFIHFSREDQLEKITSKYWSHVPRYVICKVAVSQLPGELRFETNPGGSAKYYHLYNGSIPLSAVIEAKIIDSK